MKRTVIANGTVAAPYGVFRTHVVIEGEQVVGREAGGLRVRAVIVF